MISRHLFAIALSAIAVLSCATDVKAQQHWVTRPHDWGKKSVILLPPSRETNSTLPVMEYPKPVQSTPNYLQFQSFNTQGRPVFKNPTTGQVATGNATGLIGVPVPLSEVKKMAATRPLGLTAPNTSGIRHPNLRLPENRSLEIRSLHLRRLEK